MGQTQAAVEWDAEAYHQTSDPQFNLAMELLSELRLQGNETVVDAGCGTGRAAEQILNRVPGGRVLLVDRSKSMLGLARRLLSPRYGDRVEFIEADLQTFCMPHRADGIFSNCALHFVPDQASLFQNLHRTLRPGGFFAANIAGKRMNERPPFSTLHRILEEPAYRPYAERWAMQFYGADLDATSENLVAAGFVAVDVREVNARMQFGKDPAHRDWSERFVPLLLHNILAHMPSEAMRKELLERTREALRRDTSSGEIDGEIIVLHARKAR